MDMETFNALTDKDKIEKYCDVILPILRDNGIPETPAVEKVSALADDGPPEVCLQRMRSLFRYLDQNEDRIDNNKFRDLTIELMNRYPA